MLDHQDLLSVEEIVDRKTSDIRQDVSILKQDMTEVKTWASKIGTKVDVIGDTLKLVYEAVTQNTNKTEKIPFIEDHIKNHETRIGSLELAVKRKLA